jgi:hypothetical protein
MDLNLFLPSCLPYFKTWNEELLIRKAGMQEFFESRYFFYVPKSEP